MQNRRQQFLKLLNAGTAWFHNQIHDENETGRAVAVNSSELFFAAGFSAKIFPCRIALGSGMS